MAYCTYCDKNTQMSKVPHHYYIHIYECAMCGTEVEFTKARTKQEYLTMQANATNIKKREFEEKKAEMIAETREEIKSNIQPDKVPSSYYTAPIVLIIIALIAGYFSHYNIPVNTRGFETLFRFAMTLFLGGISLASAIGFFMTCSDLKEKIKTTKAENISKRKRRESNEVHLHNLENMTYSEQNYQKYVKR